MKMTNEQAKTWLKQLQKDLIQDRREETGNASPLYYTLMQPYQQLVPDGYGDEIVYYDTNTGESTTLEQIWEDFTEEEKDELSEDYLETGILKEINETTGKTIHQLLDEQQFIEYLSTHSDYETYETETQMRQVSDSLFLTRNAAQQYLDTYGYNHPKGTVTYAMTAIRSPQYETLLKLLHAIDWDKSNIVLRTNTAKSE